MAIQQIEILPGLWRPNTSFAPINPGFCNQGVPTARYVDFFVKRMGPSIGISWIGNVAISDVAVSNVNTAVLPHATNALETILHAADRCGGCVGVQLAYCPTYNHRPRKWTSKDPHECLAYHRAEFAALKDSEIERALFECVQNARFLSRMGVRIGQLHAAHGYFFHQLTAPILNTREGPFAWQGSATREFLVAFSSEFECAAVRLSATVSILAKEYLDNAKLQMAFMRDCGFRLFDISNGIYWLDKHDIYPKESQMATAVDLLKNQLRGCTVIANGRLMPQQIVSPSTPALMFGAGRQLIADPLYFEKLGHARLDAVNPCTLRGHCHYFTRGKAGIECPVFSKNHEDPN